MTPDATSLAVLLDALCAAYGYTRAQAEEAEKYARNIEAVRELIDHTPTREYFDQEGCPRCDAIHEIDGGERSIHDRRCVIAAAWRALGDPRGAADIERAHEEALREGRERTVRKADAIARAQGREFGISAEQAAHTRGEYPATGGWVGGPSAMEQRALYGRHLYGPVNGANRGDLVEVTLGRDGMRMTGVVERTPLQALVTDVGMDRLLLEAQWVERRYASDARGMEAVEDEARWDDRYGRPTGREAAATFHRYVRR